MRPIVSVVGIVLVLGLLVLNTTLNNGGIHTMFDVPSLVIVLTGAFGMALISLSWDQSRSAAHALGYLFTPPRLSFVTLIAKLYRITIAARTQAAIGIEAEAEDISDPFFRNALNTAMMTEDRESLHAQFEQQLRVLKEEHRTAEQVFSLVEKYLVVSGGVGVLIGLVRALADREMGGAVVAQPGIYGVLLGGMILFPIQTRVQAQHRLIQNYYECMVRGIELAVSGLPGSRLVDQLRAYVPTRGLREVDQAVQLVRCTAPAEGA